MTRPISFSLVAAAMSALPLIIGTPAALAEGEHRPDEHAPIAVMGDHYHEQGEFMFSYRFMRMDMAGNRSGSSAIAPETIATTVPNRFFGMPMQPPTLRVVPTSMTMDMHMLGLMYAPSDRVTLMAMTHYVDKEMEHVTFAGPAGTAELGRFVTEASGIGDTSLSALIRLKQTETSRWHATIGVSLPTGDTDETDDVLAPTGMRPVLRMPYPMQLGSGSDDLLAGLTYSQIVSGSSSFGAQWRSVVRLNDNGDGYRLGDEHRVTAWYAHMLTGRLSGSIRVEWYDRGNISGIDPRIVAPVQTADPSRQGIERFDLGLGLNFVTESGHRFAIEYAIPVEERLDGPQLETDSQLTLGYQLSF